MNIQIFTDSEDFIQASVDFISSEIQNRLSHSGKTSVGLSGGKTPWPIYQALRNFPIDFRNTDFFIVDERYVPLDHPDSNYWMIQETLGDKSKIHFFDTTLGMDECLKRYGNEFVEVTGGALDLAILGVGHDGHFGSVFPGSVAVLSHEIVEKTSTDIFKVKERLTLTAETLLKSKKILVILQGMEKQNVLARLRSEEMGDPMKFPVELLKRHENVWVYYLP